MHGVQGDADEAAYYRNLQILRNIISEYAQKDVWNCDEFTLYYRMAPCYTIGPCPIRGKKKDKTRVIFLACTNSSGTEKFPLFVVGSAARPRCFVGINQAQTGFIYGNSQKACMNQCLFTKWLRQFYQYIIRFLGRKVLLLADNASCHGTRDTPPNLLNVQVQFLPSNTTSLAQTLDGGIIASMKIRFKKRQIHQVLQVNIDDEHKAIYQIDLLTAIYWMRDISSGLECSIIQNCWRSAGLVPYPGVSCEL